jgi:hypothetical protein
MEQINETFLNNLPVGSVVKDGYDNWHKQPDGLWTCEIALGEPSDDYSGWTALNDYSGWTALNLVNRYMDTLTLVKRGDHNFEVGQKVKHNYSGIEYTVASKDSNGWLRFVGYEHHANTYEPQYFSPVEPQDAPAEETERIVIYNVSSLKVGDLVVQDADATGAAWVVRTKEPEPEPTKPEPGTRGTALVDGVRLPGMIDEDGDFAYIEWVTEYYETNKGYEPWSDDLEFIADEKEG